MKEKQKLGEILVNRKLITSEQLKEALEIQSEIEDSYVQALFIDRDIINVKNIKKAQEESKKQNKKLQEVILEMKLASPRDVEEVFSLVRRSPFIFLSEHSKEIEKEIVRLVPEKLARHFCVIAISHEGSYINLVMSDPANIVAIDNIRSNTGYEIIPLLSTRKEINDAIEKYYGESDMANSIPDLKDISFSAEAEEAKEQENIDLAQLKVQVKDPPVVRYVNSILLKAIEERASDIHLEAAETEVFVRNRVDGVLRNLPPPPKKTYPAIVSRIKIISNLDIAERRLPQDGRTKAKIGSKEVDIRVSIIPTIYGEKVVMRLLDKTTMLMGLEELGFDKSELEKFKDAVSSPYGMVLLTGPTGSGKSTTLYGALNYINSPEKNIITVEDPVEYELRGINQIQVRAHIGLTFASCLRTILRQDPDVIMVGEIRDKETAEISIQSALTGHMVFSTLHTNDAVSVITRLAYMGIEPFLISSALRLSIAQRLVRRICPKCKVPEKISEEVLKRIAEDVNVKGKDVTFYKGEGCPDCNNKGYRGRVGLYELFQITPEVRKAINDGKSEEEIKIIAKEQQKMVTLREAGIKKALAGITSLEEVLTSTLTYE
ncbi:MAG: Flp pilus assembly complex ATPase component TadA [Candidatus Omnitrophica bacterium]|nr:Flp pilus assembly complex ATPase component TadA [Candidatus Omnitrophota bacterium]MBU1631222.1 Flp pilus assembly complex ATPase component TadA [Candidatus Omnitrophota bacterium]MBU1889797.1 Flp pilus assembly complex ATPase component TadA [Candidatus Omnitrophota bacterium]